MKITPVSILVLILLGIFGCARRGNPSGGPKDESAPITIKTIPAYKTVNFKDNEINIYFDEYIKLKDLNKNLIVSPPLKYNAEITPLGTPSKRITIKIKDTLKKNTTYTFNFGESVVDNSEGNILKNFSYIFSTGNHIDSLNLKGTISSAYSKEAQRYVAVMLYEANESFNDSTIYKEKPLYVSNSLDSIGWQINNLKKGKYHLIALKDENNDYRFQPKTDKIAFIDTLISIPTDQVINLCLFSEILDFKSYKPVEVSKGHLVFPFEGDKNNLEIKTKTKGIISNSFFEKDKDTLNYYFKTAKPLDSLVFTMTNNSYHQTEVIKLRSKVIDSLILKSNGSNTLHFRDTLMLIANNPIKEFDKKRISIFDKDTITVDFLIKKEGFRNLSLIFNKKEKQKYKIQILPNTITDFFNQTNKDTLTITTSTKKKDDYGSISLLLNNKHKNIIVQLLSLKEKLIDEKINPLNNKVTFELLFPNKYLVRIIIDKNKNGKWDTGNYQKHLQPEKVIYFNKEIEVKANWFVNETIEIK